jgi:hypothetical protein
MAKARGSAMVMVEARQFELESLYQALVDRGHCLDVSPERVQKESDPHVAVDPDFLQALTISVVNL